MNDREYSDLVLFKTTGDYPVGLSGKAKWNYKTIAARYELNHRNELIRQGRLVLKESEKDAAFDVFHEGHSSRDKTWQKFTATYWYHGGYVWISNKVRDCLICAQKNNRGWDAVVTPLQVIEIDPQLFWRIHFDIAGPFPESSCGNKFAVIAVCAFSKFPEAARNLQTY